MKLKQGNKLTKLSKDCENKERRFGNSVQIISMDSLLAETSPEEVL